MIAAAFVVIACVIALPSAALALLAIVSLRAPRRMRTPSLSPDLAVLIAAHDEETSIGATVAAVRAVDPRVRVHVVADNCTDRTAERAAGAGACVHERHDLRRPGKAAALNHLIPRALDEDAAEAFVFLDADAHPEPGLFAALAAAIAGGAPAAQARNLVVASTAPIGRLRELAFHLKCELRPLAYDALGLSAGLHGNGMCLRRALLSGYRWDERSVVEDGELHLRLVRDGVRVAFARATVRSPMPTQFHGAAGQAVRWERGKVDLFAQAVGVLRSGIATRRVAAVAAACDVFIPPLSVVIAATAGITVAGAILGVPAAAAIGALSLGCCGVYVARGIALARLDPAALLVMAAWALPYVSWKVVVVARTFFGAGRGQWTQARARAREVNG